MKRFWLGGALVGAAAVLIFAAWLIRGLYRPYRGYPGSVTVNIPVGTSAPQVARLLVERGVLERRLPFLARYAVGRWHHTLKAGEYVFDRPLRPADVYRKLILGEVRLITVLIPEGSDRFDIARILDRDLGMDPQGFLRATEVTGLIRDLDPRAPTLEGYLYPDTYRFGRAVTPARVVETLVGQFRQVLKTQFAQELADSPQSLHHVITLASLVEKETPDPAERPLIAGVFEARLEKGLLLACDPTVIYAARLDPAKVRRLPPPLTESDLKLDSPYNTYLHAGLPPGPIANPGAASIRAAFHPAASDFLYFVSNNHGGHVFARTLAQHLQNVARYRQQVAEERRHNSHPTNFPGTWSPEKHRGGNGANQKPPPRTQRPEPKRHHPGL
jgi:peptidoglycan lytic transglycosylase G